MMETLRILHIEDSERDSELVLRTIEAGGFRTISHRVDDGEAMAEALAEDPWDVILVDCTMPRFDGFRALEVLHDHGEDIPLLIVSGTVGEETAVKLMKAGASDYIMKENLIRLAPAIVREVTEAGHRRARRDAEARLIERERMLSTAQRIARLGSWERNYRANTRWWSEELNAILGRPPDYQPSTEGSYADVAHPEDRKRVAAALRSALHDRSPVALEHRIVLPDGSVRWVYCRMETGLDDTGEPYRLFGTILDITERKETERELRFQAHLLDTVQQTVVATDIEGRIVYWNRFAESFYGWPAEEVEGQPVLEVMVAEETDNRTAEIAAALERGESWTGEILVRRRDGARFWAHTSISLVLDPQENLIGFIGISFDVTERKRAEDALRESEAQYRTLLEQAADGIVVADEELKVIAVNTRACEMFGYSPQEFHGQSLIDLIHPQEIVDNPPRFAEVQVGMTITSERLLQRSDGGYLPTETSTGRLDDGRIQVIIRDITERKQAEEALRRSEREYRNLFESANDAIIIFDAESEVVIDLNRRALEVYGMLGEAFVGGTLRDLVGDGPMEELQRGIRIPGDGVQGVEATGRRPDGTQVHLLINASTVGFQGRQVVLSIHRDVTAQKELERQLAHNALHDALTGLANRSLFEDRMAHALARARNEQTDIAILMMGLDRFKLVNESLGHDVGDRLLVAVAERLKDSVREGDTVSRFGGDEFTILVENVANMREVTLVAERVSNMLQAPFILDGHEVVVTASIGIVFGTAGRGSPEDLLRSADVAMYRAKDGGRGDYVVFDPSMNATMLERLNLETDLRQAIIRDELRVYFQPTVELATGQVVGMEALVRWMHPTHGLLAPGAFIPLAEEAGLIRLLDLYVLNAACRQLASWRERNPNHRHVVLNVNLSAQGFQHPDLVQDVSKALEATGLDARDLQLEITESVIMTDAASTNARLRELKDLGVRLAIDDFGTGYSSLSYLKRFAVDTLKIDKSFVDGLGVDAEDTAIVQAVVSLAEALGLSVIAEGIETASAIDLLQEIGCTLGQGYHFSRPLPAEELEPLWANGLKIGSNWRQRLAG